MKIKVSDNIQFYDNIGSWTKGVIVKVSEIFYNDFQDELLMKTKQIYPRTNSSQFSYTYTEKHVLKLMEKGRCKKLSNLQAKLYTG